MRVLLVSGIRTQVATDTALRLERPPPVTEMVGATGAFGANNIVSTNSPQPMGAKRHASCALTHIELARHHYKRRSHASPLLPAHRWCILWDDALL